MLLKGFFDFFNVSYSIDTNFDPSLTTDDDCHRQDVRYSVERGDPAISDCLASGDRGELLC
jgi:hypothetical protein